MPLGGFVGTTTLTGGCTSKLSRRYPEELDEALTRWNQLLAGGDDYDIAHRLMGTDGQYRWFHTSIAVIRDELGKTIAFHGVMLDTAVQRNAEIALQQSEEQ